MDPDLALELGAAYMRVARVQGVNISPNLGQTKQADQTAQAAEALIDSVLKSQPGNRTALLRAGQIAHDRMILADDSGSAEDMLRFAGRSEERLNQFLSTGPLNAASDRMEAQQVIIALMNVAGHYMKVNRPDDAIRIAGRAIEIAHATDWPTQAGAALMVVALAHRKKGELDEALKAVRESVRMLEPAPGESRTGRLQPYALALIREGQILGEDESINLGRPQDAAECIERALKISEDMARRDANDFLSQNRLYFAEAKLAGILGRTQPARSAELYDDALRRLAQITANGSTMRNEAETLAASVYPLLRLGRRADARSRLDRAFDLLRTLKQYPAAKVELGSAAEETMRALAEYEAADGRVKHGTALYEELLRQVLSGHPEPETNLEDAVEISSLYGGAAHLERLAGQDKLASDLETLRLTLWQHWNVTLPNNAFVRHQIENASDWVE
jgi:tetratricopeptide (TPR) repeat protein